jgi:hypothetical protein
MSAEDTANKKRIAKRICGAARKVRVLHWVRAKQSPLRIGGDGVRHRWQAIGRLLDEPGRRLFAAAEAQAAGWGGLAVMSRITGLARCTIAHGEDDLAAEPLAEGGATPGRRMPH